MSGVAATLSKETAAVAQDVATKVRGNSRKWGKMQQFPTKHGLKLHRASEVKQAYLEGKIYLYNVTDVKLEWAKKGPGQTGIRHFKYDIVPPLRYWNPDIKFETIKVKEVAQSNFESSVSLTLADGSLVLVQGNNLKANEILKRMLDQVPHHVNDNVKKKLAAYDSSVPNTRPASS